MSGGMPFFAEHSRSPFLSAPDGVSAGEGYLPLAQETEDKGGSRSPSRSSLESRGPEDGVQDHGHKRRRWLGGAALAVAALFVGEAWWLSPYELALQRRYTCPDPHRAVPASLHDPRHLSAPIALPSVSPDFNLTLTYDTAVCNAFTLAISRLDKAHCAAVESSIVPSPDAAVNSWVTEHLGPDAFIIQVDGADRRMEDAPTRYLGACEYEFDFRLNNAGAVFINITHANQDYNAFREDIADSTLRLKPELLMHKLVEVPLELDICAPSCPTHYAARLGFDIPAAFPPTTTQSAADLPSCRERARAGTLRGSYIPTRIVDQLYPPFAIPVSLLENQTRTASGYDAFVPAECAWSHAGLRFANHARCTEKPKSVLFIGDSHARAVFDLVQVRLEGKGTVANSSIKVELRNATIGSVYMDFRWDPYLTDLGPEPMCESVAGYDAIVLSAGTHTARTYCPTTADFVGEFDQQLTALAALLPSCPRAPDAAPPKLILLTMPLQQQHLHDHDCRTGPRVSYWNRELERIARREGYEVVDIEGYSRPNTVDQRLMDGIHYLKLDAAEPVTDDVIDRLGICDDY